MPTQAVAGQHGPTAGNSILNNWLRSLANAGELSEKLSFINLVFMLNKEGD